MSIIDITHYIVTRVIFPSFDLTKMEERVGVTWVRTTQNRRSLKIARWEIVSASAGSISAMTLSSRTTQVYVSFWDFLEAQGMYISLPISDSRTLLRIDITFSRSSSIVLVLGMSGFLWCYSLFLQRMSPFATRMVRAIKSSVDISFRMSWQLLQTLTVSARVLTFIPSIASRED